MPEARRRTAAQKNVHLELMLGQIANFCPVILRNTIVKNRTSVKSIWQAIRSHFGFQSTGAHFLDFSNIKLEVDERPEDLFQRLMSFTEDNLLVTNGNITHYGEVVTIDEELSPTLENFMVLTWLRLIHADLPALVKQRYGTELTLASLKPEISQATPTFLSNWTELPSKTEASLHIFTQELSIFSVVILFSTFHSTLPSTLLSTLIISLLRVFGLVLSLNELMSETFSLGAPDAHWGVELYTADEAGAAGAAGTAGAAGATSTACAAAAEDETAGSGEFRVSTPDSRLARLEADLVFLAIRIIYIGGNRWSPRTDPVH